MTVNTHKIAIVYDKAFGERLVPLARRMRVWLTKSVVNEKAVEAFLDNQKSAPVDDPLGSGVTLFEGPSDSELLDLIWEHHGDYARQLPLSQLFFIGLEATEKVQSLLGEFGFKITCSHGCGFTAEGVSNCPEEVILINKPLE